MTHQSPYRTDIVVDHIQSGKKIGNIKHTSKTISILVPKKNETRKQQKIHVRVIVSGIFSEIKNVDI